MPTITAATASLTTSITPRPNLLRPPRLPLRLPPTVSFRPIACVTTSDTSTSTSASYTPEEIDGMGKVGARVKVKVPLKVFHVPKVKEVELEGLEGTVKQYVGVWKGKRISANLPFKVEFVFEDGIGDRPGPVKFVAHLRADEVDFLE